MTTLNATFEMRPVVSATVASTNTVSRPVAVAIAAAFSTIVLPPVTSSAFIDTAKSSDVSALYIRGATVPTAEARAIAKVRSFANYCEDWAGEGSVAPSKEAIREAELFLRVHFAKATAQAPHISASADGEINLFWDHAGHYVDVGFIGDGSVTYYAKLVGGADFTGEAASSYDRLPEPVRRAIASKHAVG
ncbi:MAG: hypothetical protein K2X00_18095 [Nitrospiraceae bacterium]|jgi:hypothetical protein|nr:hypothetical protein [Nitrospiraceae bacterium]